MIFVLTTWPLMSRVPPWIIAAPPLPRALLVAGRNVPSYTTTGAVMPVLSGLMRVRVLGPTLLNAPPDPESLAVKDAAFGCSKYTFAPLNWIPAPLNKLLFVLAI